MVLAGGFRASVAAELPIGWPPALAMALFVTGGMEALIGAFGVRLLSDAPARVDTLQRMAAFIAAGGLLAPIVASFGDSAAIWALHGEPYWQVWRARAFANILSGLTLAPAIITLAGRGRRWFARGEPRVRLEAALLAVALLGMAALAFADPDPLTGSRVIPAAAGTPIAFLLPCLLWAAVRFGPGGASLALVATALVADWAGVHGHGPFAYLSAGEAVLALQLFLSVIAVPVLCLGALIEERWHTEAELADRLGFEQLLSRLSAAFVLTSSRGVDEEAAIWLGEVGARAR